mgnify:CR=1 FL=1
MAERCAVIGIGQTRHAAKRADVSMPGLVREAADARLVAARVRAARRLELLVLRGERYGGAADHVRVSEPAASVGGH